MSQKSKGLGRKRRLLIKKPHLRPKDALVQETASIILWASVKERKKEPSETKEKGTVLIREGKKEVKEIYMEGTVPVSVLLLKGAGGGSSRTKLGRVEKLPYWGKVSSSNYSENVSG